MTEYSLQYPLAQDDLERDIAEITNELVFLEVQVKADLTSYSSQDLSYAYEKIPYFKLKLEILKFENSRMKE
jgi:hypothetical protein